MMRRYALAAILAATVSLVGAQVALAAVASTISIHYNTSSEHFHGKVSSSDAECRADRTVKVYKRTANGPSLQGKAKTDAHGVWTIEVMHASGHYYAVTPQATAMGTTCARAMSHTIDQM